MDRECLFNGQCKLCGCDTPALQFAFKACDGKCYPKLMNLFKWGRFKREYPYVLMLINKFNNE